MTYSKLKHIRRLGILPGISLKEPKLRIKTPGQHGKITTLKTNKSSISDYYKERLLEKQRLRINYGLSETVLKKYVSKAKQLTGNPGINLLKLIESRLDSIVFRLGFSKSIIEARQLINHKKIKLNNKIVTFPNIQCKLNDNIQILSIKNDIKISSIKPNFLKKISLTEGVIAKEITRADILLPVNELKIMEFYS